MTNTTEDILDGIPAILFHIDEAGNILDFRSSPFIQHHPEPSALPCPLSELLPENKAAEILRSCATLEKSSPPRLCHYSLLINKRTRHFEGRLHKNNNITAVIVWDASENTKAEEDKHQLSEQLRQRQKMEALGQLTGGIAHDFNNILASILGYADLTLDAVESMGEPELIRYQREVIDAGEKARDLIMQMLAFSRAQPSDTIALMPSPLIKETMKMLQSALPSTIDVDITTEEDLPKIQVDPTQFHQAIVNLCINARDAIEQKGQINISVSKALCHDIDCSSCQARFKGDYVAVTISDNGRGINPILMNKIFEPFFTTKQSSNNTGMGLSVAHGIVHDSDGHIVVKSQPDFGTTFCLYLPVVTKQENTAAHRPSYNSQKNIDIDAHILIVDDEESVARLQGELLRARGLSVAVYSDSLRAIEAFKNNPDGFDLLLVDQTMPGLTGLELAKEALELRPGVPIVLNSAQGERDHTDDAKKAGIKAFLSKPIPSETLLCTIIEILKKP